MTFLKTTLACIFAGLFGGLLVSQIPLSEPSIKQAAMTSVQLTKDGKGFCSGTLIDDPTGKGLKSVLTAKHCVESVGEVITIPYLGTNYDFTVEHVSGLSDLALLQTKAFFGASSAQLAEAIYQEEAIAIGYPLGASQTITSGFVGAIDTQRGFSSVSKSTAFLRSTTVIAPGSSGGGLYQNFGGEYRLVGVATGIHSQYFFVTYWTPYEEIKAFLEDLNAGS